jgi:cob(I)alamin adenosyltransferase
MGNRLTKIYTRTGDAGTTGLGNGSRVSKGSARIQAIGSVDELNSTIGVILSEPLPDRIRDCLTDIQHELFDLGGELSIPGHVIVRDNHVLRLESRLDEFNARLSPLKEFILPGGSKASSHCHVARTICRRAERDVVNLAEEEAVSTPVRQYLNRLSDLLFVLARSINLAAGVPDVLWDPQRSAKIRSDS